MYVNRSQANVKGLPTEPVASRRRSDREIETATGWAVGMAPVTRSDTSTGAHFRVRDATDIRAHLSSANPGTEGGKDRPTPATGQKHGPSADCRASCVTPAPRTQPINHKELDLESEGTVLQPRLPEGPGPSYVQYNVTGL